MHSSCCMLTPGKRITRNNNDNKALFLCCSCVQVKGNCLFYGIFIICLFMHAHTMYVYRCAYLVVISNCLYTRSHDVCLLMRLPSCNKQLPLYTFTQCFYRCAYLVVISTVIAFIYINVSLLPNICARVQSSAARES